MSLTYNFTNISGQTMNTANTIKVIMFISGATMNRTTGKFNLTVTAQFINSSFYTYSISTSGNTTITALRLSRFIFDQTLLQATSLTFVDSNIITGISTTWSQLSLTLVWKTASNFFIGFTAIAY